MPNLINTDNAGNVFYNYITPVIRGESGIAANSFDPLFASKLGTKGINWFGNSSWYSLRFPAPGFEMKTGNVTQAGQSKDGNGRASFAINTNAAFVNASNQNNGTLYAVGNNTTALLSPGSYAFAVVNDFAFVYAAFSDSALSNLARFVYIGWLREPVYTGFVTGVRGLCAIGRGTVTTNSRPTTENNGSATYLSSAADAITSPPIVCTAGTAPGDGSETFTDVVIRDAAAPNNPVGKLWNCIDMPATCNVGELWRNTGAHDGDASASEQDTYLCVMPWGTRKLGMRVWTENVV